MKTKRRTRASPTDIPMSLTHRNRLWSVEIRCNWSQELAGSFSSPFLEISSFFEASLTIPTSIPMAPFQNSGKIRVAFEDAYVILAAEDGWS